VNQEWNNGTGTAHVYVHNVPAKLGSGSQYRKTREGVNDRLPAVMQIDALAASYG